MVAEMDSFLSAMLDKKRFLDVGSHYGIFSLVFTQNRPDASAVALEPSPSAFQVLQDNLALNVGATVTPFKVAAGSANGEFDLALDSATPVRVPVRRVDDLCSQSGFRPDLIEIDVEGHELSVLNGMQSVLRDPAPDIFLEIHPRSIRALGHNPLELVGLLRRYGYLCFVDGNEVAWANALSTDPNEIRVICRHT